MQRFVRARACDFSAEERRDLDAWLTDEVHRAEYARLQSTWSTLDHLSSHVDKLRTGPKPFGRWAPISLGGLVTAGIAAVLFLAIRPAAPVPQHFETSTAEHRVLTLDGGTTISLNAETAIDLVDGAAPRIDLLRGDIHLDVRSRDSGRLEVRTAGATIRDIGTRFAVAAADQGGSVAVAEGMVELRAAGSQLVVHAGRAASFDGSGALHERAVGADNIAPWREQRWRFQAAPLSVLATELARQQRIRVDIGDPAVAALTVSGNFGFDEPERVLWAAAQVHGLKLRRLDGRHFTLQRPR